MTASKHLLSGVTNPGISSKVARTLHHAQLLPPYDPSLLVLGPLSTRLCRTPSRFQLLSAHDVDTLQVGLIKKSNNNQWNNHNPRSTASNELYKKSIPSKLYARFERAEACHKNAMENAPFFIGAVLAGNFAGIGNGKADCF